MDRELLLALGANLATIVTPLAALGYWGYRVLRKGLHSDIVTLNKRTDILEERMFYLATGRTLKQAMEDMLKDKDKKKEE